MAKYLTNKDLAASIHNSKLTFCDIKDKNYTNFDIIISDFDNIDEEVLDIALGRYVRKLNTNRKPGDKLDVSDYGLEDLVVRLHTWEHIPKDPNWNPNCTSTAIIQRKKKKTKPSSGYMPVNFPPFIQYAYIDGDWKVVMISHNDGKSYSITHGKLTDALGINIVKMVNKRGSCHNYRSYSYLDDMKGEAIKQLCHVGLRFDESRQKHVNPFAFYTTIIDNAFKQVLNKEKRVRNLRDDLLEIAGGAPSLTRQVENQIKNDELIDKYKKEELLK